MNPPRRSFRSILIFRWSCLDRHDQRRNTRDVSPSVCSSSLHAGLSLRSRDRILVVLFPSTSLYRGTRRYVINILPPVSAYYVVSAYSNDRAALILLDINVSRVISSKDYLRRSGGRWTSLLNFYPHDLYILHATELVRFRL